ncbi:Cytosine permease OS=Streptomyces tendae OX=1932 GN=GUR47_37620 PE=3 SV=1 [Streptomyces tendae]
MGLVAGLMFTTSDWFTGPLAANNVVGEYGLGWVATVVVSAVLYAVLPKPALVVPAVSRERAEQPEAVTV